MCAEADKLLPYILLLSLHLLPMGSIYISIKLPMPHYLPDECCPRGPITSLSLLLLLLLLGDIKWSIKGPEGQVNANDNDQIAENLIVDPDNTKIYFSYGARIYAVDADGSSITEMNVDDPNLTNGDLVRNLDFFDLAEKENGVPSFYLGSGLFYTNSIAVHGVLYKVKLA